MLVSSVIDITISHDLFALSMLDSVLPLAFVCRTIWLLVNACSLKLVVDVVAFLDVSRGQNDSSSSESFAVLEEAFVETFLGCQHPESLLLFRLLINMPLIVSPILIQLRKLLIFVNNIKPLWLERPYQLELLPGFLTDITQDIIINLGQLIRPLGRPTVLFGYRPTVHVPRVFAPLAAPH